jgi:hypothetical protein
MSLARSTSPLVCGCTTAAQSTQMWCLSQKSRNFLPVNWDPLSVMMEFGTPESVDDVSKERHGLLGPKVRDWACLDPFGELIHGDQ